MPHAAGSQRRARALFVVGACVLAVATGTANAADGGDLSGGPLTDLSPASDVPYAPPSSAGASAGESIVTGVTEADGLSTDPVDVVTDPVGTDAELTKAREQLVGERNALQTALLRHEDARQLAELRHDDAIEAIATQLVVLYEGDDLARLQALMAVRDELDPDVRAGMVTALDVQDRRLVTELDAAGAAVAVANERAEKTRIDVLSLGTRIAAIDAVVESRRPPTEAELARQSGERVSIDADYVFTTGPIPSIGYWGEASGGGMLSGWMGYAGAAVGGIGCEPPDAALQATGTIESGEASWYGPGFQGNPTANGEVFDTAQLTAAHRTLPFGTIVRVYSSATARCAFVRINDRGPFIDGRVIDLSRAAADAIGMESVAPVQLEVYARPGEAVPAT